MMADATTRRRDFLKNALVLGTSAGALGRMVSARAGSAEPGKDPAKSPEQGRILQRVRVGDVVRYNREGRNVIGDTWACAWGADGTLYTVMDDTAGFDMVLRSSNDRNMAIGRMDGAPPDLQGKMVNGMEAYGRSNQLGADGACWKGNGLACLDGTLYLSVSRHWYHVKAYDHRQIARDASIVKSSDGGATWQPHPYLAQPLPNPLFPGPRFATPFFVDYGQDGHLPSGLPDEADRYVYAVSTDGYWNNGNALHLGRCLREGMPKLELGTWEFFCGQRSAQGGPIWRPGREGLEACFPILSRPFAFGQTGMTYLAALRRYLLVGWYYPQLSRDQWQHQTSVWEFYESPTPWGPWRACGSHQWHPQGFYNPCVPTKFASADGRHLWALTCGDFNTWDKPLQETLYSLYMVRMELEL